MADKTKFKIEIYCKGIVTTARVRGKRMYLFERAFLDHLAGYQLSADLPPRPVPDPSHDI